MYQAGLVLEGGGMKGVYTSGVLDFFLDKGIGFSSCYGVSAGACSMCSYASGQRGRAYSVTVDYLEDKNYCSIYSLMKTGDLFGVKMCYDTIPHELNPYDYKAFEKYAGTLYSVVTNIETGRPEYIPITDMENDIQAIRASASLPLVSRNVEWKGHYYLDGGISDAIPLRKSMKDGNQKNVVIMTKEVGYRRKPSSSSMNWLIRKRYEKYPKVYELMRDRHIMYNETLDFIRQQQEAGSVFLIQPQYASKVGRIEKDKTKLKALYDQGYQEAEAQYERLMEYLEK